MARRASPRRQKSSWPLSFGGTFADLARRGSIHRRACAFRRVWTPSFLSLRQLEDGARIVLENFLAIRRAQPLDVFDHRFDVVHGAAVGGIDGGADARALGAEETAVDANGFD